MARRRLKNTSEFTTHDEDFEALFINSYIGKGLFAKKDFEGGTLLLEYCGKLLSDNDAAHLESESPNRSDYLFSFQHKGKFLCIDAYFTTSKARYINDAKETQANTFVKKVEVHGVPRLFIYSKKKIEKGTEIRYDYGNPDAEWRQDKCCVLTAVGGDALLDENADGESDIDETTNEGEDKCCDLTTGGGDPLSDENANDESDIDETTNEGEDKCCDLTAVGGDALLDENADGESDIDETTNEGEKRSCDSTSGGSDPLLDESAGDESDIDETTNEREDKCYDLTAVGGDALLDENADDESDIDETTNEGEKRSCDSTSGGGDPLLDESAGDESDIDETTNEREDKCCDSTSGRSDPLFDENADGESDIDETTNEGEDKCCDITSGGGVIPLDESENDESDIDEIAVGGKGIFSTLVPYSDSDSDCSYIIPMPTSQQRRLGSSLWGETSTESSKSPNKKDSAVLRTTATVSNSHDHIEQDSSSDAGNWSPESDIEAEDARGSKPGKRCEKENVAPASSSIKVMKTHNKGKRKWDKHQYCVYCMKTYAKLPRHLEQVHLKEKEVAEALNYDKGSCKRKELLTLLRNKGNHSHNVEVWQSGSGCLIPARRTPFDQSHDEFLPCNLCFGYFSRDNLWKHKKNCFMASESTMKDKRHQSTSALLLPFSQEVSQSFKDTVFASMTYDSISFAARHDHIIVQYGERMFAKLGHERHQVGYISQKMRELARLLLKIKETKPDVKSLYDCISPKQFDTVLEAVRNLAGLDPQTGKYKTPSLALKLGHSLQTCALIVKAECIKSEDPVKEDQADKFSKLAVIEWAHKVGTGARTTLEERKWNKPNMLPLSEDIRQLHAKLSEVIEEKQKLLALSDDVTAWYALAEATLSKLILFNRRRSGEVQRIKLADFERRCHDQGNDDVMDSLSSWEKTLCNKLERIEIRGKRGRKVPVLLTKEMVQVMELLAAKRTLIGVSETNDYFFARPNFSSMEPLRGADCIRKYALKSGAKHPSNLTSTKLRKQIATVSQILCLKDHELDVLAGFLGHDIRVHREYYRLPENTLQMAKVARLLLLMEKGAVGEFKDKKLDEIEVPLDDPSYTDESEGESELPYDEEDLETEDKEGQNEIHESEEESDSHASTKKKVLNKESDGEETKQQQLKNTLKNIFGFKGFRESLSAKH
ncbi:uncharacterized protein [Apostichopus japonicus]|uniref:uncharacterized protein isoform X2 n=1 Tax=Stichopus japonicus TaxID=307972 RepID=UPI003AB77C89